MYVHTNTQAHTHINRHTDRHAHTHTRTRARARARIHIHIHIHVYVYVCMCVCVCVCVCVQVLHGGMHDVSRRLQTFTSDFPHSEPPLTPEVMVLTGLFSQALEPGSDRVICNACGVVLEGWEAGQVPSFVHFAASPHCRLLQWPHASLPAATADSPHRAPPAASPLSHEPELEPPAIHKPIRGWGQMLAQAGAEHEVVPPALFPPPPPPPPPAPPARCSSTRQRAGWRIFVGLGH